MFLKFDATKIIYLGEYTGIHYNFYIFSYKLGFNPVSNEIEIHVDGANAAKNVGVTLKDMFNVTISDNSGTARSQGNYSGDRFSVPANSLVDGTYIVTISNGTMTDTQQLVIKR